METIQEAYNNGMIDPWHIGFEDFKDALLKGREECIKELEREVEYRSLDDLHATMSRWACFKQRTSSSLSDILSTSHRSLQQKKAKKNRRKITATSKKRKIANIRRKNNFPNKG